MECRVTQEVMLQSSDNSAFLVLKIVVPSYRNLYLKLAGNDFPVANTSKKRHRPSCLLPYLELMMPHRVLSLYVLLLSLCTLFDKKNKKKTYFLLVILKAELQRHSCLQRRFVPLLEMRVHHIQGICSYDDYKGL